MDVIINVIKDESSLTLQQINSISMLIELCFGKKIEIRYFLSNCETYVLSNSKDLIALVQVECETSRRYWLQHVCTHPNYRNQGHMKRLLSHIMTDLPHQHPRIRHLRLEVSKSAKVARYLYCSQGFKPKRSHMKYKYPKLKVHHP